MNLVDSSGRLEYLADGQNAKLYAPAIEKIDELIISTANIYEVYKKILKEEDEDAAIQVIGIMQQAKVIGVSAAIAIQAAKISFKQKIPMADSLIYVTARLNDATVWTEDMNFKDLDGVKYFKR